jgi:hypothetical protein
MTPLPFAIIGSSEDIRTLLCGAQDHNEHCKGWRWHMYVQDDKKRMDNVMAELRQMHAERRARLEAIRLEAIHLEAAE